MKLKPTHPDLTINEVNDEVIENNEAENNLELPLDYAASDISLEEELIRKNDEIEILKKELQESQRSVQQIKQNLFENIYAIENLDRERIAHILHDGIGQDLASIRLMLKSTINCLNDQQISDHNLHEIHEVLGNIIKAVRNVSNRIIPCDISKFGFINSLQSIVDDLSKNFASTTFTFYSNLNHEITSVHDQLAIYRIIQEATNNIIKHAKAKNASVQISSSHQNILLTIEDNGIGFNYQDSLNLHTSRGLHNIVERTKALNADLFVESKSNEGTCLNILISFVE